MLRLKLIRFSTNFYLKNSSFLKWDIKQVKLKSQAKTLSNKLFNKYLLLTNTVIAGTAMLTGDLIQQEIEFNNNQDEEKQMLVVAMASPLEKYNWNRAFKMCITGMIFAPWLHYFYQYLNFFLPIRSGKTVFKKVFVDQTISAPVNIVGFFGVMSLLDGKPYQYFRDELKDKFWDTYKFDCCLWIPSQCINFYFLRVKYQVIFTNFVSVLYNIYLSHIKHVDKAISI